MRNLWCNNQEVALRPCWRKQAAVQKHVIQSQATTISKSKHVKPVVQHQQHLPSHSYQPLSAKEPVLQESGASKHYVLVAQAGSSTKALDTKASNDH